MRYVYVGMLGIFFSLLWLGCSEDGKNTVSVEQLIVSDTLIYDTVVIKTTITSIGTGILATAVSDTVVSIKPEADSLFWLMVTTTTVYNATFLRTVISDSLVYEMLIYKKMIHDTILDLNDTCSDTTILGIDSLIESYITISSIIDTISTSVDTLAPVLDTHFVTTYLIATTGDSIGGSGNVGVAAMDWRGQDTVYSGAINLLPVNANSSVYTFNNSVYILESGGEDSVLQIAGPGIDSVKSAFHIGLNADIRDITFVNESKAYITQYNSDSLVEFNPVLNKVTVSIDIEQHVVIDPSAIPYMIASAIFGEHLYVLCQRLDTQPGDDGSGMIVILSTLDNSFAGIIKLNKIKPMSMDMAGRFLYVSCMGVKDSADGGVVQINLTTNSLVKVVLPETDSTIQNFSDITMVSTSKGYIKATDAAGGKTYLYEFNPTTGTVTGLLFMVDSPEGDVIYDGRYLYLADRSATNPGVLVINPANNSIVAGPISMGTEPPNSLAIMTVSKKYFQ